MRLGCWSLRARSLHIQNGGSVEQQVLLAIFSTKLSVKLRHRREFFVLVGRFWEFGGVVQWISTSGRVTGKAMYPSQNFLLEFSLFLWGVEVAEVLWEE